MYSENITTSTWRRVAFVRHGHRCIRCLDRVTPRAVCLPSPETSKYSDQTDRPNYSATAHECVPTLPDRITARTTQPVDRSLARSLAPLNTVSLPLFPTLQYISRLTTAECSHHDVQLSLGEPHACSDEVVCIWWLMSDRDVKMFRLVALKTFIKVEVVRNYVQSVNYSYCIEASFK